MKIIVQDEWYSIQQCKENPKNIYVFGDNIARVGNGGQAQVRPCSNTFGVVTKRSPSMNEDAFFNDSINDFAHMFNDLYKLKQMCESEFYEEYTLVFPVDGLGTGLAELDKRSPFIFNQMKLILDKYFNIVTRHDGTLCKFNRDQKV